MNEYHKIQTVFKRSPETNYKTLVYGDWAKPEFEYLQNNLWQFTEKIHGACITIDYDKQAQELHYYGKSEKSEIPKPLLETMLNTFLDIGKLDGAFPDCTKAAGVALYGEGCGAKIQKGGENYGPVQNFVLFDVKLDGHWLSRQEVEDVALDLDIRCAPIVGLGTLHQMVEICEEGYPSEWGDFTAEGIVARPQLELRSKWAERVITKLKHKDFPEESE